MTQPSIVAYSPPMMNGWQYRGSFVIKFREDTDVDSGRFSGRIEHVGSGQTAHFDSAEQLYEFLHCVLRRARVEFQQADTLAENLLP
jgi:hypothetical protein